MARTVKPEEFALKRTEILDVAMRLVLIKGYEQMAIRDILDELQISSGAFHHYFDSREALLQAFIDRIQKESEKPLLPILHDPKLNAIEKLQGFFDTLDRIRIAHKAEVEKLSRVWYTDANALVRQKVSAAVVEQRAPLITEIVQQGVREGIFNTPYPKQAGEVILGLLQAMADTHAKLFLSVGTGPDSQQIVDEVVTTHAAYMDAVERVLGAPSHSLYRAEVHLVKIWVTALE
jgi:TetR/AcrR family transcriptional regulator, transcriptional repressor for nem operon